ncbi:hypothetical protein O0L34_g18030 [Tuta absoluta]|nr:hypothetical protein O0L34_g18030 [Tuta absoluta]
MRLSFYKSPCPLFCKLSKISTTSELKDGRTSLVLARCQGSTVDTVCECFSAYKAEKRSGRDVRGGGGGGRGGAGPSGGVAGGGAGAARAAAALPPVPEPHVARRYNDMAPKHWEEGPPRYHGPTEYERPPPYYYPGPADRQ